jgi:predicted DNA-binding transcriptional regulator AlpA
MMGCDKFPRPRRIGLQAVTWPFTEIDDWIARRPLGGPRREGL